VREKDGEASINRQKEEKQETCTLSQAINRVMPHSRNQLEQAAHCSAASKEQSDSKLRRW